LKKHFGLFLIIFCSISSFAQSKYWQQQTNFNIAVTLNDVENSLTGFEKIEYYNNSPDSLTYIWIHLWPNAYKNDRTAFSDQQLENGNTAFYFSEENKKGYINKLNFKVDNVNAFTEDHPQHQDIVKLILPNTLAPGKMIKIETPFHVKLPYNFSRGGHIEQSYQITQWYPKPAVYDKNGWHEMPYLDQGEFYNNFGNYDVQITLPSNYIVASTGELQNEAEKKWLKEKNFSINNKAIPSKKNSKDGKIISAKTVSSTKNKVLQYVQNNVVDFAWFADKDFIVKMDTLKLPSGKIIDAFVYVFPTNKDVWQNSISFIKKSILTKSDWVGEYPYSTMSVVDNASPNGGGMEYPTITLLTASDNEKALESVINHEVGHNWFQGIIATNERQYPWMDEGMNTYYDNRYSALQNDGNDKRNIKANNFAKKLIPDNIEHIVLEAVAALKKDQSINTSSENFSVFNYGLIGYIKAGEWMQKLEKEIGASMFDKAMQTYFKKWKFKHPLQADFKAVMEEVSGKNLDIIFSLLDKKGSLDKPQKKQIKFTSFFNLKETNKYNYISIAPAVGYNLYDKLLIGALIHNYSLPLPKFQFAIAPLYATKSNQIRGIGKIDYNWYQNSFFQNIKAGINFSHFSSNHSLDTNSKKIFESFLKISPNLTFYFNHSLKSSKKSSIEIRTFLFEENNFNNYEYQTGSDSVINYPTTIAKTKRYLNQATFLFENNRALYPHNYKVQVQQGEGFYRLNLTGNYFFNYAKGGGLSVRVFAAKFNYIGTKKYSAYAYQPKLLANNGTDDYTANSYFVGRTASSAYENIAIKNSGIAAQQIMIENSGGLKMRLDQYTSVQGYSERWIAAVNVNTTLPENLFPFKMPLKIFLDMGTYAEAWDKNGAKQRILYTGGLQLSLLKNALNIYMPLFYSKAFKEQLLTDKEASKLSKKITFSINLQQLKIAKFFPQLNF
jgi:Peptidase family M1 domain